MITVIIPAFNEEKQIEKTISAVKDVFKNTGENCRIVVVDDGSADGTWDVLKNLAKTDAALNAVRLSRNFGKEAAIMAGLSKAGGDACIIMDADLQHPPEIIPEMIALWKKGYEVVEAVKEDRGRESAGKKIGASLFYKIMYRLSGFNLENASDFKLLDAKVVKAILQMPERETFFRGLSAWVGYSRTQVHFKVQNREYGKSGWSRVKLFRLAVTALASFSSLPLQFVTFIGILFLIGSFILGIQTLVMKFRGLAVDGFTTVILLILITGSCLMISLGLIGTYIARIYNEVKARPRYIISEECGPREESIQGRKDS
ncbi:MAG TPA: glycosyltransferase [Ruminiclostridium sp.]|jgi:dolichol-phosphate mannosyltransferase|nr:glycosyltransferase family 2 protein [Clostridiaceae bacterium]HAA26009.1 glycosyltransferase [Ruminiclostridium sp.]